MDPDIARWTLEFLINQNISDNSINNILKSTIPPLFSSNNNNLRLRKLLLLRSIESEVSHNRITEDILEFLERIEEIDCMLDIKMLGSMKSAYYAVAVECTMNLWGSMERFRAAVERIWRGRVRVMMEGGKSGLCSDELRLWRRKMENSVNGKSVMEVVLKWDGRQVGRFVRVYLDEARAMMGPSFLEMAGEAVGTRRGGTAVMLDFMKLVKMRRGGLVQDKRLEKVSDKGDGVAERELCAPDSDGRSIGAVGCSREDKYGSSSSGAQHIGSRDRPLMRDTGIIQKANVQSRCKHVASHRRVKGAKIAPVQESDTYVQQSEYDTIPTPEVEKLQEELKRSCSELHAIVKDPLPDALRKADALVSNLAKKHTNTEHLAETVSRSDACSPKSSVRRGVGTSPAGEANIQSETERTALTGAASHQNETQKTAQIGESKSPIRMEGSKASASIPSSNNGADPVLTNKNATIDQPYSHQTNVTRRSLLERNKTAETLEWDDSIDNSPEGPSKRMKLCSPKRLPISPLKKFKETKISRRRKVKRWSNLEEDTLRTGVKKFGKGNWKLILNAYRDTFEERTEVDLKDKWRNMTRYTQL